MRLRALPVVVHDAGEFFTQYREDVAGDGYRAFGDVPVCAALDFVTETPDARDDIEFVGHNSESTRHLTWRRDATLVAVTKALRLLPIALILSVLSVWMFAAGAVGSSAIEAEFQRAEQLAADGAGERITIASSGSEVLRQGRRAFPKSCYTFAYTAGDEVVEFTERRMCAPYWRPGIKVELVYEKASPGVFYWVRSPETETMFDGPQGTARDGVITAGAAILASLVAVVVWLVSRRNEESPLASASGD